MNFETKYLVVLLANASKKFCLPNNLHTTRFLEKTHYNNRSQKWEIERLQKNLEGIESLRMTETRKAADRYSGEVVD